MVLKFTRAYDCPMAAATVWVEAKIAQRCRLRKKLRLPGKHGLRLATIWLLPRVPEARIDAQVLKFSGRASWPGQRSSKRIACRPGSTCAIGPTEAPRERGFFYSSGPFSISSCGSSCCAKPWTSPAKPSSSRIPVRICFSRRAQRCSAALRSFCRSSCMPWKAA